MLISRADGAGSKVSSQGGAVAAGVTAESNRKGEYSLWQRRFWEHTIRDEEDFARHVDYVHFNPVKHGLVGRVRDWPYSSFHRYVRSGLLPEDWAVALASARDLQDS